MDWWIKIITMAQRIVFIDIAKAVCIILVVVGHYVPDNSPGWYVAIHDVIYTFHMPLFMFASGYVYIATRRDIGYGSFLMRKLRRLMVPYLSTSVIVITIKLLTQGGMGVEHPVTVSSYLRMFYQPEAGYFLWFIWALWWMFVLVPLFRTPGSRLVLFIAALALHYVPLALPWEFCISECRSMLVFFMLGVVAFENKWLHAFVNGPGWRKTVCASCLFAVANYVNLTKMGGGGTLASVVLPYAGIWFTLEVSKSVRDGSPVQRRLMAVAASSYIIYLFHTTFEGFAKAVFRKLPLDSGLWYVFVPEALVVIASGIVLPMLLFRLFKKYRATRLLFGL